MSQPEVHESVQGPIDGLITADGDPYADAVAIIAYTLERALGEASGGMGQGEFDALARLAFHLVTDDPAVRIDFEERRQ